MLGLSPCLLQSLRYSKHYKNPTDLLDTIYTFRTCLQPSFYIILAPPPLHSPYQATCFLPVKYWQ